MLKGWPKLVVEKGGVRTLQRKTLRPTYDSIADFFQSADSTAELQNADFTADVLFSKKDSAIL